MGRKYHFIFLILLNIQKKFCETIEMKRINNRVEVAEMISVGTYKMVLAIEGGYRVLVRFFSR